MQVRSVLHRAGDHVSEPALGLRVLGEDLPRSVAIGLLVLGGLLSLAALHSWNQAAPLVQSPVAGNQPPASLIQPSEYAVRAAVIDAGWAAPRTNQRENSAPLPMAVEPVPGTVKSSPTQTAAAVSSDTKEDCAPVFAVRFRFGSNLSRATTEGSLARLSAWLQGHPTARLSIDGYSDQLGPVADRFAISQRRAQVVAEELVRAGAPRAQLQVRALGHYVPGGAAQPSRDSRLVLLHVEGHAACSEEGRDTP